MVVMIHLTKYSNVLFNFLFSPYAMLNLWFDIFTSVYYCFSA